MRFIQNLRIGTKLAVSAVFSILLIGGMIFAQITGNAAVRKANETANGQQTIARDAIDTKASIRGMQTGARDIRLASTAADLQKAARLYCGPAEIGERVYRRDAETGSLS